MLESLVNDLKNPKQDYKIVDEGKLKIFSPGATISSCELSRVPREKDDSNNLLGCTKEKENSPSKDGKEFSIVRTIGTDDILAAA